MENRFNRLATKQRFAELGISNSYLTETLPSNAPSGSDPVINIKQMIDGRVNFKVIYNIIKNTGKYDESTVQTSVIASKIRTFSYNDTIAATTGGKNSPSNCTLSRGNNILSDAITSAEANSSTKLPLITTISEFTAGGFGDNIMYTYSVRDKKYYFIPSNSNTHTRKYVGLGVLSDCWYHNPTVSINDIKNNFIVARRIAVYDDYNYIIEVNKDVSSTKIYTYYNNGSYYTSSTISMNKYTNDTAFPELGSNITTNSVNNRLCGNFYDILNGLNHYGAKGIFGSSVTTIQNAVRLWCTNNSGYNSLHIAPRNTYNVQGSYRAFDKYCNITYFDLNTFTRSLDFASIILYPGTAQTWSTSSWVNISSSATNVNSNIEIMPRYSDLDPVSSPDTGGRILYIIPACPSLPSNVKIYCNYTTLGDSGAARSWVINTKSTEFDVFGLKSFSLSSLYHYIFEIWRDNTTIYWKQYRYYASDSSSGSPTSQVNGNLAGISTTTSIINA